MSNMKVGTRLGLGFGAVLVLLAIIIGIGVRVVGTLNDNLDVIVTDRFPKTVWASEITGHINVMARAMRNVLLVQDPATVKKELDRIPQERKAIEDLIEKLRGTIRSDEGKKLLGQLTETHANYLKAQDDFLRLAKDGNREEGANYLINTMRKQQNPYFDAANAIIAYQTKVMNDEGAQASKTAGSARMLLIVLGLIDVVMSDHNPQDVETKRLPFAEAAAGAIGLETMLAAALRLAHSGEIELIALLRAMSTRPAQLLGLPGGTLNSGAPADLIVVDTEVPWVVDPTELKSKCKNTPFDEARMLGRVVRTIVAGRTVYEYV